MTGRVPVFVCGEPARGDDAAGFAAVELLPGDVRARAEIHEVGRLDVLTLLDLPADEACVVVDAVAGIDPGEVWVRPLPALVGRARALADAGRARYVELLERLAIPSGQRADERLAFACLLVTDINMPRMDGLTLLARQAGIRDALLATRPGTSDGAPDRQLPP